MIRKGRCFRLGVRASPKRSLSGWEEEEEEHGTVHTLIVSNLHLLAHSSGTVAFHLSMKVDLVIKVAVFNRRALVP